MSEREVRGALDLTLEELGNAYEFIDDMPTFIWDMLGEEAEELSKRATEAVKQALSEPPDVVVLLRWLRGKANWAGRVGDIGQEVADVNVQVAGNLAERAYNEIADHIEQQFHIRLTAGGWEWVEEGEQ